jgi:small subunit ribosomal protein S2
MPEIQMKELLEAGVHFGHQTKRWNPKMKQYIFGARNGIYIIDLQKTLRMFKEALSFVRKTVENGGSILFVGTKKQAQDVIREEAKRAKMFYVTNRWVGGMLTNFVVIRKCIERLKEIDKWEEDGTLAQKPKKEQSAIRKERVKLEKAFGGLKELKKPPSVIFIIDTKKEKIAVTEGIKAGIPIVAVVDTNCDPDGIAHVVPGNDDAIKAINLFARTMADACLEGAKLHEDKVSAEVDKEVADTLGPAQVEKPAEVAAAVEAAKPASKPAAEKV